MILLVFTICLTMQYYNLILQSKCSNNIFCKIKVIKLVFLTKNHKYNYNLGNIDFAMPKYLTIAKKNMKCCKVKGANQPIGRLQKNRLF